MKRAGYLLLVVPIPAAIVSSSCRSPTQVTVGVEMDSASCAALSGLAVVVGPDPAAVETRLQQGAYVTVIHPDCRAMSGTIGTLVVLPVDDRTDGALAVLAGVGGTDPTSCRPDNGFEGCIIARRRFSFIEHTPLTLPVRISYDCLNVPCNAESTCLAQSCVESRVSCKGETCGDVGVSEDGGLVIVPDAPTSNDASAPDNTVGKGSDSGTGTGTGYDSGTNSGSDGGSGSGSDGGSGSGSDGGSGSGSDGGSGSATGTAAGAPTGALRLRGRSSPHGWGFGSGSGYAAG